MRLPRGKNGIVETWLINLVNKNSYLFSLAAELTDYWLGDTWASPQSVILEGPDSGPARKAFLLLGLRACRSTYAARATGIA